MSDASSPAVQKDFGRFEIRLDFPKAILRADGGLQYRSVTELGYVDGNSTGQSQQRLVILEEEFEITRIRIYCILGINPHERLEEQPVYVSLRFRGPGLQDWSTRFIATYQQMTRTVAEVVFSLIFFSSSVLFMSIVLPVY